MKDGAGYEPKSTDKMLRRQFYPIIAGELNIKFLLSEGSANVQRTVQSAVFSFSDLFAGRTADWTVRCTYYSWIQVTNLLHPKIAIVAGRQSPTISLNKAPRPHIFVLFREQAIGLREMSMRGNLRLLQAFSACDHRAFLSALQLPITFFAFANHKPTVREKK